MKIKYYGHSCFLLTGKNVSIATDPYDPSVGYDLPSIKADIVTVSHQHFDHNYLRAIRPGAAVVDLPGDHHVKGVNIKGYEVNHDSKGGTQRGKNIIFWMDNIDGVKICHLGDLGEPLSDDVLDKIKEVDILFAPVGGFFTLEPEQMAKEVRRINPKILIPMHFAVETTSGDLPIKPADYFLKLYGKGEKLNSDELEVTPENLPLDTGIYVLDFYNK
ncbi:MAG: MBL fold metallo-hydrolase [Thermoanaerobacteraceae bacterium]|nr:MBL fold metallo-hydrolase [Thermoanaerobacteraceae bacterium]